MRITWHLLSINLEENHKKTYKGRTTAWKSNGGGIAQWKRKAKKKIPLKFRKTIPTPSPITFLMVRP
jgi:hypothetical protein